MAHRTYTHLASFCTHWLRKRRMPHVFLYGKMGAHPVGTEISCKGVSTWIQHPGCLLICYLSRVSQTRPSLVPSRAVHAFAVLLDVKMFILQLSGINNPENTTKEAPDLIKQRFDSPFASSFHVVSRKDWLLCYRCRALCCRAWEHLIIAQLV